MGGQRLASGTGTTHPAQRRHPGLQLPHPLTDRLLAQVASPCHSPDPAMAQIPGLGRGQQPSLPLVQMRKDHIKLRGEPVHRPRIQRHTPTKHPHHQNRTLIPKQAHFWGLTPARKDQRGMGVGGRPFEGIFAGPVPGSGR